MEKTKYKVLVVEDDSSVIGALKDKLTRADFEVVEARDGAQGLVYAKKEKPDIILLDILMPNMDGITMLKNLREEDWGKEIPVIVLTVSSDMGQVETATQYDVFDYLIKTDWSIEDVVKKVRAKLADTEARKAKKSQN